MLLAPRIEERIWNAIERIERRFQVDVTLHDHAGLFRALGHPEITRRLQHVSQYCNAGTGRDRRCIEHCYIGINRQVKADGQSVITHCWKGCSEVVVPVFRDGVHVVTCFAGGFRSTEAPGPSDIQQIRGELAELTDAVAEDLASTLHFEVQGMLNEIDQLREIQVDSRDRKAVIRRFIHYRSQEPVKLQDLASVLFLSSSRAGHLVTELFGVSFQELVLQARIHQAKAYLRDTAFSLEAIAMRVGFSNRYYFSRQFKAVTGKSPGQFRREETS